ncbi:MAG TPA: phage tail domain-containing protein, partial [Oscillospiraceae bacterium]|nr:phage tail domain-containing protein [Oscillospiraceae bacterium]
MSRKFVFTNSKGQSVEFTNDAPLFMKTYHGTGGSPVDIHTQKSPHQDGEALINTTLEMRDIQLVVAILGNSTSEVMQHRRRLSQVLNPKLGRGKLRFESETGAHEIDVQPNGAPAFPGGEARGALYQECLIELLAPNPFW